MPSSELIDIGVLPRQSLKVSDFLTRLGVEVDSPDDQLSVDDTLIQGEFLHQELRSGLFLHISNGREEHAFTLKSQIREGLSCVFFLEGSVDLKVGDRHISFRGNDRLMEGTSIVSTRLDSFERRSPAAQPLRHVVLEASPEWLGLDGLHEVEAQHRIGGILKDHLNTHRWTMTPRMIDLVREIASPTGFLPALRNLYLEGRAIEIVGETLASLIRSDRSSKTGELMIRKDVVRLDRAREFIAANLTADLTVEIIAREAGLNPSGLQQLFHSVEGTSIFEYVRKGRLHLAFSSLRSGECSVAQASAIAGYSSPTNFTRAFRRAFGLSPREAIGL